MSKISHLSFYPVSFHDILDHLSRYKTITEACYIIGVNNLAFPAHGGKGIMLEKPVTNRIRGSNPRPKPAWGMVPKRRTTKRLRDLDPTRYTEHLDDAPAVIHQ